MRLTVHFLHRSRRSLLAPDLPLECIASMALRPLQMALVAIARIRTSSYCFEKLKISLRCHR